MLTRARLCVILHRLPSDRTSPLVPRFIATVRSLEPNIGTLLPSNTAIYLSLRVIITVANQRVIPLLIHATSQGLHCAYG